MGCHDRRVIAVVDDDAGVRDSLRFLLETAGHTVETYESGAGFLALADPSRLGCLLLDYHMPGMTGLDLLCRMRARGIATPALLLSSMIGPAVARRAADLGVASVLEKPLAQEDVIARIESVLV